MADQSQVRSYRSADCVVFRKTNTRFGGLSNMAPGFPLEVNGVRILTSEALYQACRFPDKPDVQRLIIEQTSPMTAKMKSKPHRRATRSDWDKVRVNIMRWCLRVKLAQNWQKFSELLLATGDRPIVEESRKDDFWGAKAADDDTLVGMNVLGRLLMELRQELQSSDAERLRRVEPLAIPHFLLYGKPIGVVVACTRERTRSELVDEPGAVGPRREATTSRYAHEPAEAHTQERVEPVTKEEAEDDGVVPRECKRLAEVDFPIAKVSAAVLRREKRFPVPRGLPSTMHQWWARRPLGSCRSVLLGLLLPDPCDPRCPDQFKKKARTLLARTHGRVAPDDAALRTALLTFLSDFADWDNSSHSAYLEVGRGLVKAAHGNDAPLVADPFAGGGAIPLEALRVGCDTHASDLNPVACLIERVLLESIPRYASELIELLDQHGSTIVKESKNAVAKYFPHDADGSQPAAYFWARTVRCESPNCGAEIPIFRSPWLSKKKAKDAKYFKEDAHGNCVALLIDDSPPGGPVRIRVARGFGKPTAQPGYKLLIGTKAPGNNNNVICPCCKSTLSGNKSNPRVPTQLIAQNGGADVRFDENGNRIGGAILLAVMIQGKNGGRDFRAAQAHDYTALWEAHKWYESLAEKHLAKGQSWVPSEPLNPIRPSPNARGVSAVTRYGMNTFGDLFTYRQKIALTDLCGRIAALYQAGDPKSAATADILALAMDKVVDFNSALTRWRASNEDVANVFGRQALPMVWDFVETNPVASPYVDFDRALSHLREVVAHTARAITAR